MSELVLRNRQRAQLLNRSLFRRIAGVLLTELLGLESYALGVHVVAAPEMARLNRRFLNHPGATDVISFDYSENKAGPASRIARPVATHTPDRRQTGPALHGEIFICLDQAVGQARQFRTTWQSELVRYLVHGVLHLRGYDDLKPGARRVMKREENRLLRSLSHQFSFQHLLRGGRRDQPRRGKSGYVCGGHGQHTNETWKILEF